MTGPHNLMAAMFWGGVIMALPPVAISVGVAIYLYRQYRAGKRDRAEEAPGIE